MDEHDELYGADVYEGAFEEEALIDEAAYAEHSGGEEQPWDSPGRQRDSPHRSSRGGSPLDDDRAHNSDRDRDSSRERHDASGSTTPRRASSDRHTPSVDGSEPSPSNRATRHSSGHGQSPDRDKDNRIERLQEELVECQRELSQHQELFRTLSRLTESYYGEVSTHPEAIVASVAELYEITPAMKTELQHSRQREAALGIQLTEARLEGMELRRSLHTVQQSSEEPNIIQMKQLLLDPAVHREFQSLKTELERAKKDLKSARDDLQAGAFDREQGGGGKELLARLSALQAENEELGRELSEGKIHTLELRLQMTSDYADHMRKSYLELEDHCTALDEENEKLQQQVFVLRRQMRYHGLDSGPGNTASAPGQGPGDEHGGLPLPPPPQRQGGPMGGPMGGRAPDRKRGR